MINTQRFLTRCSLFSLHILKSASPNSMTELFQSIDHETENGKGLKQTSRKDYRDLD